MEKKKDIKEKWCPLTGDIDPYDEYGEYNNDNVIIILAREFWGVKQIVQDNTAYAFRPSGEAFDKANKIYQRCHEIRGPLGFKIGMALSMDNLIEREKWIEEILFGFRDLKLSPLEIFSIAAIYYGGRGRNHAEYATFLLALTEKYSPDAMRGKKVIGGAKTSGEARRAQVQDERGEVWAAWQARADEIWGKNPGLSKLEAARRIKKENPGASLSTIRGRIKK